MKFYFHHLIHLTRSFIVNYSPICLNDLSAWDGGEIMNEWMIVSHFAHERQWENILMWSSHHKLEIYEDFAPIFVQYVRRLLRHNKSNKCLTLSTLCFSCAMPKPINLSDCLPSPTHFLSLFWNIINKKLDGSCPHPWLRSNVWMRKNLCLYWLAFFSLLYFPSGKICSSNFFSGCLSLRPHPPRHVFCLLNNKLITTSTGSIKIKLDYDFNGSFCGAIFHTIQCCRWPCLALR